MARRCARRRREQRGAVAVEAGLVSAVLLLPLLLGTLQLGQYLWGAQRIDAVTPGVPVGLVVGVFTCDALEAEVAAAVATTVVDLGLGVDLDADDVEVHVVDVDPVVGATVQVHLEVPATGGLASLLPLPGGGALVTDFSQRLDDVTLSEGSCG